MAHVFFDRDRLCFIQLQSIEISLLPAEYRIDRFRKVILTAKLDVTGPQSLTPYKKDILHHSLNGSYRCIMNIEPRKRDFRKIISVYTNTLTTFAAAWIVSSTTMASATLDATSQTGDKISQNYSFLLRF